jgi:hypothetical protein
MSDWKDDLESFFEEKERQNKAYTEQRQNAELQSASFLSITVVPAFEEIQAELEKYGREVIISNKNQAVNIQIFYESSLEFDYWIKVDINNLRPHPEIQLTIDEQKVSLEGTLRVGVESFTIEDISKEEIIGSFLSDYYAHIA